MTTVDVNILAVLVCGISAMVLGSFWYSPSGFGKTWMKESGITKGTMDAGAKRAMAKSYSLMFIGSLVTAYVLAHFLTYAGATTIVAGVQGAFWAWLGFIAPVGLGVVLWEGKSWKLYAINVGFSLVSLGIMGAILATWR